MEHNAMRKAQENFEEAVNELLDVCKSELGKIMFDEDMDERALGFMKTSFKLVDASMALNRAQIDMMIEMNDKLDKLTGYKS